MLLIISVGFAFIFRGDIITRFRPEIRQYGAVHINMTEDTTYIYSKLEITSRTCFKLKVDTIKYKVTLFDQPFLEKKDVLGIELPAFGKDTIGFKVKIPHKDLRRNIKAHQNKTDSAGYIINISLQISTPFWRGEIPFNKSARLKLPHPPELELVEIKYKKIRLRSILADATIKVTNHSNISLAVKHMIYKMKIMNQGDVNGNYLKTIRLKPKGITVINLPMEININHVGKLLWAVLNDKDNYHYVLLMNATIESIDPVKESFRVELVKTGNMELKK
jgi:LEA14-like dessication related protein